MPKSELNKQQQMHVIQQLAMFERPTAVKNSLKEIFDVDISLPGVMHYDIKSPSFPKKWRQLFEQTRQSFIDDTAAIPIANKAFRLRELDNIYHNQKARPAGQQNPVEMRAALEQAAKESGNQFTNRTEHTGPAGKPLIPDTPQIVVYLPDTGRGDGSAIDDNADPGVTRSDDAEPGVTDPG